MADFAKAHEKVIAHEGGYANNPADRGGETYKGIARKSWPAWTGWKYVDGCLRQIVKQPEYGTREYSRWVGYVNVKLAELTALQRLVAEFYRENFWKNLGELHSQEIAEWVYDKNVNTGSKGSSWLQEALVGVTVDGCIGPKTIAAANAVDPKILLPTMKAAATNFYADLVERDPSQKQFLKGWLARV